MSADRADEIVADVWRRIEGGEAVDVEAVFRAHPECADDLRARFAALRRVKRALAGSTEAPDSPPPPQSLAGTTLGPYRLERSLGAGGMGTVYLATVERRAAGLSVGERVAVKVVHPHLLAREGFFKRFLREAEIGRRLRHDNVVRTIDADAVQGGGGHVHFLAMEYVEGQTLRGLLEEVGRVPEELCRHVGREVAKALVAIHEAGAVHRDLKPDNVLITTAHVVKVMDLGVARLGDDPLGVSQTGAFVGSVRYAAPEQFRGRGTTVDGRADLYALGLLLYELATGRHPFPGDDFHVVLKQQMTETPRAAGEVNPQLSPFFEEVLRKLLAKDRQQRFASAAELLSVLVEGEKSAWWHERAVEVRATTKRPLRRVRIPRETALYGRDEDLAKLRALYDAAKSGDGRVVLVEGEAGIGKSRLVDEFVGRLEAAGEEVNFLYGSYPPGGAATASGAFSTAYREQFGEAALEETLKSYLTITPLLVPAFAALLRGDAAPSGVEPLTKDSLQTVFVHATRALAAERTTIVLIDDLHFAPEEGRALFTSLALAVPGHRVLLVGTSRPGLPPAWLTAHDRMGHASRLPLARLGPKDLSRLLVDAFRSERLAEELGFKIAAKSDGNPYFVFELIRGLREGQFIRQQPDGTWVTTQVIRDIQIPSTVRDLVGARLADLDEEDKDLLDVASCIGFEFDARIVAGALGNPVVSVLKRLARIEARHRLVRSSGERFVFDHHQVQETIYASLPPLLAQAHHAAIGTAIEAATGAASKDPKDVDGAVCVDLADHFLKGGEGTRALRYLESALRHLEHSHLHETLVRLAGRALGVNGLVGGRLRCDLLGRRASRLGTLGRVQERLDDLLAAQSLAEADGDPLLRAKVLNALGNHHYRVGNYAVAERVLDESITLSAAAGALNGEADARLKLGLVFEALGRITEAGVQFERSAALGLRAGDPVLELASIGNLGNMAIRLGRFDEGAARLADYLQRARSLHDERREAMAVHSLGTLAMHVGSGDETLDRYARALAIFRRLGDRPGQAAVLENLAWAQESAGREVEAYATAIESAALCREVGDRRGEAHVQQLIACIRLQRGETGDALRSAHAAVAGMRELDRSRVAGALIRRSLVLLELGDLRAAARDADEALTLARRHKLVPLEINALGAVGRTVAARSSDAEALAHFDEALAKARDIGLRSAIGAIQAVRADALQRLGRREDAIQVMEEAVRTTEAHGQPGDLRRARATLACMRIPSDPAEVERVVVESAADPSPVSRFLVWRATADRTHLAEAKRLLDLRVANAPPEYHETMLANVRVNREIVAAAKEHLGT